MKKLINAITAAGILVSAVPAYQIYAEEPDYTEDSVLVVKEGETETITFTAEDAVFDVSVPEESEEYISAVYDSDTYTVSVTGISVCEETVLVVMKNPDAEAEEVTVKVRVEAAEEAESSEEAAVPEETATEEVEIADKHEEETVNAGETSVDIKVSSNLKGTLTINGEEVAAGSTYTKAEAGSEVTISYTPSELEKFVKWVLTGAGSSIDDLENTSAKLKIGNEALEIGAELQLYHTVTVINENGGNASASAEKALKGEKVTITASTVSGKLFDGFSAEGITLTDSQKKANKIEIAMPEADVIITAKYITIENNKFITAGGKTYYYKNNKKVTGLQKINGKEYFFNSDGVLQTGVQTVNGKKYYFTKNTNPENCFKVTGSGWKAIDGKWYFLDKGNSLHTGWLKDSGKWYYMNGNGVMLTGWQKINGKWYYLYKGGSMAVGWLYVDGKWYYLNSSGAMLTGWQQIKGKWYFLKSSGAMATGWQQINGKWYFLNKASGAMATGWLKDSGKWYYLNSSGSMKSDTWYKENGKWYYFLKSGAMAIGWLKRPDAWYYFRSNGSMYSNGTITINGKNQRFAPEGQWIDNSWIASQTRPFRLYVNRAHCTMTVYLKDYLGNFKIPYKAILISVGLSGTSTPSGWSEIGQKYLWYWYKEDTCWLRYVSFFSNGGKMMHSEAYYTQDLDNMLLGEFNKLGYAASHGCVRMAVVDAKWVYENCYAGTKVYVYDDWSSPGPLGKPSPIRVDDSSGTGWDPTDPDPNNPWNW